MLVTLENVSKNFGEECIFSGVTCKIEEHSRIGLVGQNGAGKTTLLSCITGKLDIDSGNISLVNNLKIGYLKQNSVLHYDGTIISELKSVYKDVYDALDIMKRLSKDQNFGKEYHDAENIVLSRDGYQIEVKINTVLQGMGFANYDLNQQISLLSGGEQTRLAIARLLLEEPNLMILDEPTNHLDFNTLSWLEDYLLHQKCAILVVSHDRYFLDKICTTIWYMGSGELTVYNGNYSKYKELKEFDDRHRQKVYKEQIEKLNELEDYVARNLVRASTTKMAQSRRKQAEKLKEQIVAPQKYQKPPRIRFRDYLEPVSVILNAEHLDVCIENKFLIKDASFTIRRGDRVAIIGPNGAGKTTLLHTLMCECEWGRGVKFAYYDQGAEGLPLKKTLIETLRDAYPLLGDTALRDALAALGIVGEDVFKLIGELSGGERARVKLALIMLDTHNVLILDEPTNHLDLESKEALEQALEKYHGTIILVSHDRYLLSKIPNWIYAIESESLKITKGNFETYEASHTNIVIEERVKEKETTESQEFYSRGKEARKKEAKRRNDVKNIEERISKIEIRQKEIEKEISESQNDYEKLQNLCQESEELQREQDDLLNNWLKLQDNN